MEQNKLIIKYRTEEQLLNAIAYTKKMGIELEEVLLPYPSHEVLHAVGRKTYLTHAAFVYGVVGWCLIMAFLFYTSVIDWPLNVGGKPSASIPSFLTLSIVVTILFITVTSIFTFNVITKVYPGKKLDYPNLGATDDQFVLIIDQKERTKHEKSIDKMIESWPEIEVDDKFETNKK